MPRAPIPDPAKLRREAVAFRAEVLDKVSALATAAFGLVAALAWNGAIQAVFKKYYGAPDDPNAIGALVGYALVVTLVAVAIIIAIGRFAARLKKEADASAEGDGAT